jgi:hypothetical protein
MTRGVVGHVGILDPGSHVWAWFPDIGVIHITRHVLLQQYANTAPATLDGMARHGEAIRLYNRVTSGSMVFHYDHSVVGADGRRSMATFKTMDEAYTLQVWDNATGWAQYRARYIHPDTPNLITPKRAYDQTKL